jgi:capsular exopolysaccharide synthesis family protein
MSINQYQAPQQQENTFNAGRIITKILQKWHWLILSVSICMGVAYIIDRYTKPTYQISSLLHVKPATNDKTNVSNILYGDAAYSIAGSLSNEILFLKSRSLIEKTIRDLDFRVDYFKRGQFVTSELYKYNPIEVLVDSSSTYFPYETDISCIVKSKNSFILTTEEESLSGISQQIYKFGQLIDIKGFKCVINLRYQDTPQDEEIIFRVHSIEGLTNQYRNKLLISQAAKESSVLKLSLEGQTPQKAIDFLNQLTINLIENNIREKNTISSRTVNFINQMLNQNKDSLSNIENKLERFKGDNSIVSVQVKGGQLMGDIKQLEQDKVILLSANQYFNYLEKNLRQSDDAQIVVPSSLGVQDATLNAAIAEIINLQLENRMLKADNKLKNPYIELNNQKIAELKQSSLDKIKSLRAVNEITLQNINNRINLAQNSQQKLPSAEREYNNISRNYNISESLVQFLMEKRAVADITRASNTSDYKQVDIARIESGPVKKKGFDFKIALLAGLFIPLAFIVISDLLNDKVNSRDELMKLTPLPLLGIVVRGSTQKSLTEAKAQKTALAESFRSVRSNLSYISENNGLSKIILFTSSISGEGKSFCAKNLGFVLSLSNKRTLLINADMRKVGNYQKDMGIEQGHGLSNYLSGMLTLAETVQQTQFENLYVIHSGELPPNPSELLLSGRMKQMLNTLKDEFDYIIIDTPPIGLIADGLELMKSSDVNIIVTRQGYTKKSFLNYINELYIHQKYPNMAVLFNDVNLTKSDNAYGIGSYGYGYYAEDSKKSIVKRLFSKSSN